MRALPLLFVAACATPSPAPVEPTPPPVVTVGEAPPVVMTAATTPPEPTPSAPTLRTNGDGPVPVFTDDPTRGDDLAPVTVVVFTDYECPPCKIAIPTLSAVQEELGDDTVRLVHKHFPLKFHRHARPAAEAAVAVHHFGGYRAFDAFQQRLFDNQMSLADADLQAWVAESGVSRPKLTRFLDGPAGAKVDRDIALARELDVAGVPDVRVNCQPLDDTLEAANLRSAILAEQERAEAALREGTPRDAIYRTRCEAQLGE